MGADLNLIKPEGVCDNPSCGQDAEQIDELKEKEDSKYASEKQNRAHRDYFVPRIFWLAVVCIVAQYVIVFLNGFAVIHVESSVLISVVCATVIEVLGILLAIVKAVFPSA
jgi:hypothetical protein